MALKHATPFDYWLLGLRMTHMLVEAQTVVALRMMGMAGGWPVSATENTRMVNEKGPAFIKAAGAATAAAMKGRRPDQIVDAALRPIGLKTRSNARRLSKGRGK